ncbi:hypothetical protein B0J11DRAFT_587947 [Dendryphion nanum]|uniref:Uncharacterized protein n=1 Tax=Dendryphion nanum TaxID=256645 RepID=A0A9P9EFJ0_9PLEO|nr:hypothetical protein B0J11DRAFT_587947 [Dendryphion nanum]
MIRSILLFILLISTKATARVLRQPATSSYNVINAAACAEFQTTTSQHSSTSETLSYAKEACPNAQNYASACERLGIYATSSPSKSDPPTHELRRRANPQDTDPSIPDDLVASEGEISFSISSLSEREPRHQQKRSGELEQVNQEAPEDIVVSEAEVKFSISELEETERKEKRAGELEQINQEAPEDIVVSEAEVKFSISELEE